MSICIAPRSPTRGWEGNQMFAHAFTQCVISKSYSCRLRTHLPARVLCSRHASWIPTYLQNIINVRPVARNLPERPWSNNFIFNSMQQPKHEPRRCPRESYDADLILSSTTRAVVNLTYLHVVADACINDRPSTCFEVYIQGGGVIG